MNLNLLSGLLAAGDNLVTDSAALPQDDIALSSAFAQLLGERLVPEGKPNGKLTAAQLQLQAATPEAPALSHHQLNPLLEKAGLLSLTKPQDVLVDASTLVNEAQPALTEKPDEPRLPPAATLQALLAMLPAVQPSAASELETVGEPHPPEATGLLNALSNKPNAALALSDKPSESAPDPIPQQAQITPVDKNPSAAKVDLTPFAPDTTTDRTLSPSKFAAEPAQPSSAVSHTMPLAVTGPTASAPPFSTMANTVPTAPLSAPLGSPEWQQALGQQVLMFQRNGQQNAELRLHPQELGALQITLKLDDNQAQLHIASAHSQVRAAVEAALPQLRQALAESGINLGQSSVGGESLPQQSPQQHAHSGGQPAYREQHGSAESPVESINPPPTLQTMARAADGVDIFA